jgi:hypothetical protein
VEIDAIITTNFLGIGGSFSINTIITICTNTNSEIPIAVCVVET